MDCGVRGNDGGTEVVKLECEDATTSTSPFRVKGSDGGIWALSLVETNATTASNFRVRYYDTAASQDVIKALGSIPPGIPISSCEELQMIGYHPAYPRDGIYVLTPAPPETTIDCSATNSANWSNPKYENQLWQLGYYERFNHKGLDGIAGVNPATGKNDDNISQLSLAELGGKGFQPISSRRFWPAYVWDPPTDFVGIFNGNGNKIKNLTINRPIEDYLGLFGMPGSSAVATIKNVGLENVRVRGCHRIGGLVGQLSNSSTIIDAYSTGSVTMVSTSICAGSTQGEAGGLVGTNYQGIITRSYSTASVSSEDNHTNLGGFIGWNNGTIDACYATGDVTGPSWVGGFAGWEFAGTISNSYSTGNVIPSKNIDVAAMGGFAGGSYGSIINSYSTGDVKGSWHTGGLVGQDMGTVKNSFSFGRVDLSVPWSNPTAYYYDRQNGGFIGCLYRTNPKSFVFNCGWWADACPGCLGVGSLYGSFEVSWKENDKVSFYNQTHGVYQNSAVSPAPSNAWDFDTIWRSRPSNPPCLRWDASCA